MCFGPPYICDVLSQINREEFEQLVVFPAFPHYTGSTTGLVRNMVEKEQKRRGEKMNIMYMDNFHNHPLYIQAIVNKIKQSSYQKYDHILFSYHGIPISHVRKNGKVGDFRYAQECFSTSDLIAEELGVKGEDYSSSFQSRMSKNWLSPFTDATIEQLAKKGVRKLLVVSPSFLVDCLETIEELGVEYQDIFMKAGGKKYKVVECLNDNDDWVDTLSLLLEANL
jgi:ferrochelatase